MYFKGESGETNRSGVFVSIACEQLDGLLGAIDVSECLLLVIGVGG